MIHDSATFQQENIIADFPRIRHVQYQDVSTLTEYECLKDFSSVFHPEHCSFIHNQTDENGKRSTKPIPPLSSLRRTPRSPTMVKYRPLS
jgi:hypothetical protein